MKIRGIAIASGLVAAAGLMLRCGSDFEPHLTEREYVARGHYIKARKTRNGDWKLKQGWRG